MKIRRISIVASCLSVIAALVVVAGCRAFQPEAVQVNKAPETYIIGAPPEDSGGYYRFHVYWYGRDEDGRVERFVWALTDTSMQNPDTTDDEEDERFNPAEDASTLAIGRWTTRTDSVFNFKIDDGVNTSADKTLHVVAVDDFGDYDRTPARLHFFTNTLGSPDLRFFRVEGADTIPVVAGQVDTVGFGMPYEVMWRGNSPNVRGYSPAALRLVDTVAPYDDGLFGYKWKLNGALGGDCQPSLTDCWHPRNFDTATNDSFSVFAPITRLFFANNASGDSPFLKRLPSGTVSLEVNSIDIAGVEVANYLRPFDFIVNFDPETKILDGPESIPTHPSDTETYPYYIQLNDPVGVHHPFRSGDRIPDRTYVVVKALARDDPRDQPLDPDYKIGFTGYVQGVRQNFTGGVFPFASEASVLNTQPTWDAGVGGWYGDTLGFLTAPNTRFTINMQAVDEHERRDGSPDSLSFDVGFPPCLQCIELQPRPTSTVSGFTFDAPCVENTSAEYLASNECLSGVTELRVSAPDVTDPDPARDLEQLQGDGFILIDRGTGFMTRLATVPTRVDSLASYILGARRFKMGVLLHGKDDEREAWPQVGTQAVRRIGGVQYEVSYGCDPFNDIKDGGGNDDIRVPTWGQPLTGAGLEVNTTTGLWKLEVAVFVPTQLLMQGVVRFRSYLNTDVTDDNAGATEMIYNAVMRQFGDGVVEAVVLDQTLCGVAPYGRPASFNFFRSVRPTYTLSGGESWRDCSLPAMTAIALPLSQAAMASLGGQPVSKRFRLTLNTKADVEDVVCTED
jgi:hypothetical protein